MTSLVELCKKRFEDFMKKDDGKNIKDEVIEWNTYTDKFNKMADDFVTHIKDEIIHIAEQGRRTYKVSASKFAVQVANDNYSARFCYDMVCSLLNNNLDSKYSY